MSKKAFPLYIVSIIFLGYVLNHFLIENPVILRLMLVYLSVISLCIVVNFIMTKMDLENKPISKVNSAAQGSVELYGKAKFIPGTYYQSPYSKTPCVWAKYTHTRFNYLRNREEIIDSGVSYDSFLFEDDTGIAIIISEHALVYTKNKENILIDGPNTYKELMIYSDDPIFVSGFLKTVSLSDIDNNKQKYSKKLLTKEFIEKYQQGNFINIINRSDDKKTSLIISDNRGEVLGKLFFYIILSLINFFMISYFTIVTSDKDLSSISATSIYNKDAKWNKIIFKPHKN